MTLLRVYSGLCYCPDLFVIVIVPNLSLSHMFHKAFFKPQPIILTNCTCQLQGVPWLMSKSQQETENLHTENITKIWNRYWIRVAHSSFCAVFHLYDVELFLGTHHIHIDKKKKKSALRGSICNNLLIRKNSSILRYLINLLYRFSTKWSRVCGSKDTHGCLGI